MLIHFTPVTQIFQYYTTLKFNRSGCEAAKAITAAKVQVNQKLFFPTLVRPNQL